MHDAGKLAQLEKRLQTLIEEQEAEMKVLNEKTNKVSLLQIQCEKQIEEINKKEQEHDKAIKTLKDENSKLKSQIKDKDSEILKLTEKTLEIAEFGQKMQTNNQELNARIAELTNKLTSDAEMQTDRKVTKNVMVNTNLKETLEVGCMTDYFAEMLCQQQDSGMSSDNRKMVELFCNLSFDDDVRAQQANANLTTNSADMTELSPPTATNFKQVSF